MIIYIIIFLTLFAALIASLSQIAFKASLGKSGLSVFKLIKKVFSDKMILLGLLGYAASLVIYLFALDHAPLSVVYPIFASSFIFVSLFSKFLLHEKISLIRYLGISIIFFGILIVAISY